MDRLRLGAWAMLLGGITLVAACASTRHARTAPVSAQTLAACEEPIPPQARHVETQTGSVVDCESLPPLPARADKVEALNGACHVVVIPKAITSDGPFVVVGGPNDALVDAGRGYVVVRGETSSVKPGDGTLRVLSVPTDKPLRCVAEATGQRAPAQSSACPAGSDWRQVANAACSTPGAACGYECTGAQCEITCTCEQASWRCDVLRAL